MKKAILGCLLGVIALAVTANSDNFNDVPDRYTVQRGDTLWDISDHFLKTPWLWPEIWHVNPDIANPHLIYPGDVIKLVYIDGQPRLTVERSRNVKLSPQIKETPHAEAIPALPLEAIQHFLSRNRVVEPGVLEAAPYVLAGSDKHLLTGSGQDFYARGDLEPGVPVFGVYRKGDAYVDPYTGEMLGIRAKDIGTGRLKAINEGGVATFKATRSAEEIRIADRLLPHEERKINATFYPKSPEREVEGVIIAVEDGLTQVGRLDVVALNKGARDGVDEGAILAIYKRGETIKDRVTGEAVELPSERAGLLMVFRTFEKMSYGLVMKADRPLAVGDEVHNP
ncbi:LysM peptidoglycan-binding domain-containing protein [Porticoccus sp. W117]|uniref:LysM peptidoglycan-binding domain-containing protein n=1 Tax=Porticoccus sp. W117 TaxID=3054777 RepID=UPI002598C39E|nr:LysM peptidoglycan-binding domain-containing protein [Porticoccus sp. W117]MDM3870451.1 LysM peptidoglycan-binding domain-containing protein [Porticoccus sp. W117]